MKNLLGWTLDDEIIDEVVRRIQKARGQFLVRISPRISLWLLEVGGKTMKVAYDKHRHNVAMIYPLRVWHKEFLKDQELLKKWKEEVKGDMELNQI